MAITRAKATGLLNKTEMGLYDDSRANALRRLGEAELGRRIERTRKARDRARDLVQRQKLAARGRTGGKRSPGAADNQRSKDKAELLADILKRFEAQLKQARTAGAAAARAGKTPAKRAAGKKTPAKAPAKRAPTRPAAKKTAAKKTATKKTAAKKTATKKAAGKATKGTTKPAKKAATGKPAKKSARKRGITPQQALANTRALLEAKQEQARQPKPWQSTDGQGERAADTGFQSSDAARRAEDLHAGESRLPAIQGSISTRDRLNQGKRDHRGSTED
ncbi:hypothetical protein [Luteimonas suaedae]|uniref:hypothetical protein n=1 Tax=Luteimonas suaedae TaxID=2605430 RepID=UPI0016595593|nr:hypothetical protein [Luteimonas suaedae]